MRLCLLALPLAALAAPNPEILGRIPLYFEPNVGQAPASARFIARGGGLTVYLSPGETTLASKGDKVKMKLEGSRQAAFEGLELQPGVSNYYRGNDPAKWRTGVPHYGRVISRGVYEGIDLVYYGNARRIEYDFVVAPGASPDAIQLAYEGADKIRLDDRGDLVLTTHSGELRQHKPLVYQEVAGRRVEVGANYRLRGSKVGFELASYDHGKPLVIDPVVSYGTLLGGSGNDRALGVGIDSSGAIYVGGSTESANFPLLGAADSTKADLEGFVTKLNSAGAALVFSTYFGGSGRDDVSAFAIQPNGNSFLTGATFSNDLPVASAFQASVATVPDAFAAKFNPDGTLAYATYLGGSGDDRAFAIAVDSSGNAYVAGGAASANFPGAPGNGAFSNAFVSKLSPAGSSLLFTYRAPSFGSDSVHGVAVDATGIYIAGSTEAPNFPVAPAPGALQPAKAGTSRDAFVAKVRPDGSGLLYGTYLGGASLDEAKAIAVDASGNAYVTGYTSSNDFPVRSAMFPAKSGSAFDAFVTKINAGGTALVYSTYLGGANGHDLGNAIAVDSLGRATVGGSTESADFPTYSAYQTLLLLYRKGFLARLRADGSGFDYSTFFGGPDFVSIQGLWLGSTETWVAGDAEISSGAVFPAPGGYDTTPNGLSDAFVARFGEGPPPVMVTVTSVPAGRIVKVDDRPVVTPFTFAWQLPLSSHILDANAPQGVGSAQYDFVSWSQGGSAVHMVPTPSSPTTYTVTYALSACTVTPTPASAPVGFEGGQLVFRIDATPGCNWTAGPLPNWVQGAIPPPGSPNLQGFPLIVEPNPGAPRTASIQVGGSTITVVQDGTNAGLPAPTILSPAQGAALRDQSSVKLSWAPIVGASRYDIRVLGVPPGSAPSHTVFHGTNAANTTSISLPNLFGNYRFLVRACNASGCGAASSVDFNHVTTAPVGPGVPGPVVILSPATGQVLTSSTHEFRWARAELATRYLVQIKPRGSAVPEMQIVTRSLSTVYTLRGLPEYELQVTPCGGGCTTPTSATFSTNFPPIPTGAPTITSAGALSGNSYRFDWTAVPGADVYRIQIVQPTSGPGGGALTVASTQTAVTNVALSVPAGAASALVAACNGRGCGPYSAPFAINPPGPSPAAPVLGQPISVLNIDGPLVLFTWNRVPGDNGSNTVYRLYAQDLSRNEPALDVQTTNNFYAGLFAAEGRRYDALVVANPGAAQATGPAVGFIVQGTSSPSPTPVIPTHESTVRQGDVRIGWTPIGEGARFYQYAVYRAGEAAPVSEGMLQDLQVILPLPGQGAGRATSESCAPARSRTRQCASSDPTPGGGRGRMLPAVLG